MVLNHMAMRYIESEFGMMGHPGVAKAVAGLREEMSAQLRAQYGTDDVPLPNQPTPAKKDRPQDVLALAVSEFKAGPLTPELVTKTFQTIWQVRAESAGIEVVVAPCDRTKEELAELTKAGRGIGYLPEQLSAQQDHVLFAKMFPRLGSYGLQEGNLVANEVDRSGWFDYEVSVNAPYRNTTEDQLREAIEAEGKKLGRDLAGMNVNEYIVASEDSKLFTGKFLDQESGDGTWTLVRLLGSRGDSKVVYAGFSSDGDLYVYWVLHSQNHLPYLGGRSVGVEKT